MTHDDDRELERSVEARLARFRPSGPPPGLRDRIVPPVRSGWTWAAVAILVLATVGLSLATRGIEQRTAAILSAGEEPEPPAVDSGLAGLEEVTR